MNNIFNSKTEKVIIIGSSFNKKELKLNKKNLLIQIGNYFNICDSINLNIKVPNAGWDDKKKLHNDYQKIKKIYSNILHKIYSSPDLIKVQGFKYQNKKELELVIGIWLRSFIVFIYRTIEEFNDLPLDKECYLVGIKKIDPYNKKPLDMNAFYFSFRRKKEIIDNLKLDILLILGLIKDENIKWVSSHDSEKIGYRFTAKVNFLSKFIRGILIDLILIIIKLFFSPRNYLACDIDILNKSKLFSKKFNKLIFSLHTKTFTHLIYTKKLQKISKKRNKNFNLEKLKRNQLSIEKKIEFLVEKLINLYMPTSIHDGFGLTLKRTKSIFPNRIPNHVITSSIFNKDTIFNIFTIIARRENSKFVILQHGGGYGFSKINDEEEFQLKLSDFFFSWGWEKAVIENFDKYQSKIISSYGYQYYMKENIKIKKELLNSKFSKRKIYIALNQWEKIDLRLFSFPSSDAREKKQMNLVKFLQNINLNISNEVIFRGDLDPYFGLKDFFEDHLGIVQYKNRFENSLIEDLSGGSYLFITDSNSTAWLQALSINIPSILLLGNEYDDINLSKVPIFKNCLNQSLIFKDPLLASKWINSNFSKIDLWWYSKNIQKCRLEILNNYFKKNLNIDELIDKFDNSNFLTKNE